MNFFPEYLYPQLVRLPTPQARWLQQNDAAVGAVAAVITSALLVVPTDFDLVLHSTVIRFQPGAAQTLQYWVMDIARGSAESGFTPIFAKVNVGLGAAVIFYDAYAEEIYLPAQSVVRIQSTFNAGAAANFMTISWRGIFIPRTEIAG